jgi:hypothetical protein
MAGSSISKRTDPARTRLASKEDLENLAGRALAQESRDRLHERYVRADLKIIQNSLRPYPSKEEDVKWEQVKKVGEDVILVTMEFL